MLSDDVDALERYAWPLVARLLYQAADLRQSLREFAQSAPAKTSGVSVGILSACDRFRDDYLAMQGIRLQDRMGDKSESPYMPAIGLVNWKLLAAEKSEKAEVSIWFSIMSSSIFSALDIT